MSTTPNLISRFVPTLTQWNVRGITSDRRNQIRLLSSEKNSIFICLQETKLNKNCQFELKGYKSFHKNKKVKETSCGGVLTLIKNSYHCREIVLKTKF